jgi:hypothetical protein
VVVKCVHWNIDPRIPLSTENVEQWAINGGRVDTIRDVNMILDLQKYLKRKPWSFNGNRLKARDFRAVICFYRKDGTVQRKIAVSWDNTFYEEKETYVPNKKVFQLLRFPCKFYADGTPQN